MSSPTIVGRQHDELRAACAGLLDRLPAVTDDAVTAGLAASPGVDLTGPRLTEATVRERNRDAVRLFLVLAGELTTDVAGDLAQSLQHNARLWAAECMGSGTITLHQVVRFSTAAHAVCLRTVVDALPDHTLPGLLGPLASWHNDLHRRAHAGAEAMLRTEVGTGLQRDGDQWRNWLLESALVDDTTGGPLDTQAPTTAGLLVLRTGRAQVERILTRTARPPSWWTVYRATPDSIVVVVDLALAGPDWADAALDCVAPANGAVGAVVRHEGPGETLAASIRLTLALARSTPPGPVTRSRVVHGVQLRMAQALRACGVDDDLNRLLRAAADTSPDALATVTAFLGCDLRVAKAADQLGIHRSTLDYRLSRIARHSGVDPRTTGGAAAWWTALTVGRRTPQ